MSETQTHPQTLNESLARQRAATRPEVVEVITRANERLEAAGDAPGIAVGERAPDFTLPDANGRPVALRERLASGPVVLSFYRGAWCPYCNLELRALQATLPRLRERGASLIAVSPQRPDDALSLSEKLELEFDVLSDVDQQTIRDYRVQIRVPAEVEDVHLSVFKKDVSEFNADGSWNLPVPATFVIASDGVVRARHVAAEYTQRMEPQEIVAALELLDGRAR